MADRNQDPDFVLCRNNGLTAVMSYECWLTVKEMGLAANDREAWETLVEEDSIRIFVFCETSRLLKDTMLTGYVSGTAEDLERLLAGKRRESVIFYVPFSHGSGNIRKDKAFIATPCDLRDVFGESARTSIM